MSLIPHWRMQLIFNQNMVRERILIFTVPKNKISQLETYYKIIQ